MQRKIAERKATRGIPGFACGIANDRVASAAERGRVRTDALSRSLSLSLSSMHRPRFGMPLLPLQQEESASIPSARRRGEGKVRGPKKGGELEEPGPGPGPSGNSRRERERKCERERARRVGEGRANRHTVTGRGMPRPNALRAT